MSPRREDLGSWLEGTPDGRPDSSGPHLPLEGPGSAARPGRRVVALCLDWVLSLAISAAFFPSPDPPIGGLLAGEPMATIAVFGVSTAILVGLLGHSVGHRVAGLRVVRLRDVVGREGVVGREDGSASGTPTGSRPPGLLRALLRTALLCLVIPAVIWERGGRGLHDVAAGTAIVRR